MEELVNTLSPVPAPFTIPERIKGSGELFRGPGSQGSPGHDTITLRQPAETPPTYGMPRNQETPAEANLTLLRNLMAKTLVDQKNAFKEDNLDSSAAGHGADPKQGYASSIPDNHYWGVERTSDRVVAFATTMAGDDPSHFPLMRDMLSSGVELGKMSSGGELTPLAAQTCDAISRKIREWAGITS